MEKTITEPEVLTLIERVKDLPREVATTWVLAGIVRKGVVLEPSALRALDEFLPAPRSPQLLEATLGPNLSQQLEILFNGVFGEKLPPAIKTLLAQLSAAEPIQSPSRS